MSRKKNSKFASILFGPALVIAGILALWENEGRFNYYLAAKKTTPIEHPSQMPGEPVSLTGNLDTNIPIMGEYVKQFDRFHLVRRHAEIYSWDESTDSDGNTTWSKGWYSSLDSNSRNSGLRQRLSSSSLYPPHYMLDGMLITPDRIHFADDSVQLSMSTLTLSPQGQSLGLQQQGKYLFLDNQRSDDLGDERVSYTGIPNEPLASYFGVVSDGRGIGRQFERNDGFISAIIGNDGILHHLVNGDRGTALGKIRAHFTRTVWLTRLGGTVAIVIGIMVFFSSFMSLLYRIPLLGNVVQAGVIVISLAIGLPLALLVMIAGLIVHNPLSAALPLALVIGGVIYMVRRSRNTRNNARKILSDRTASMSARQEMKETPVQHLAGSPVQEKADGPVQAMSDAATQEPQPLSPGPQIPVELSAVEQTFVHMGMMAMLEGGLDKKEKKMLMNWGRENGISQERMDTLTAMARQGDHSDDVAKKEDLEMLALMALVDGELSKGELTVLVALARKMGLTDVDVRQIINDIESGQLASA
jgi:hypothetical protein